MSEGFGDEQEPLNMDANSTPEVGKVTAAEMLALLRSIEWMGHPDDGDICPKCGRLRPGSTFARTTTGHVGHRSECELGRMIRRLQREVYDLPEGAVVLVATCDSIGLLHARAPGPHEEPNVYLHNMVFHLLPGRLVSLKGVPEHLVQPPGITGPSVEELVARGLIAGEVTDWSSGRAAK